MSNAKRDGGIRMLRERAVRRSVGAPAEYPLHPLERMVIEDEARHQAMCRATWEAAAPSPRRLPPEDTIEGRLYKEYKAAYLSTFRGTNEVKDACDATDTERPVLTDPLTAAEVAATQADLVSALSDKLQRLHDEQQKIKHVESRLVELEASVAKLYSVMKSAK